MKPAHERVLARCTRDEKTGCLIWSGATFRYGYGNVRVLRRDGTWGNKGAHIVMWEHANGPVPAGRVLLHSCDRPACCEPSHLSPGTQKENLADMTRKGRRATVSIAPRNPITGRYESAEPARRK